MPVSFFVPGEFILSYQQLINESGTYRELEGGSGKGLGNSTQAHESHTSALVFYQFPGRKIANESSFGF